jgi:hypothetical protein
MILGGGDVTRNSPSFERIDCYSDVRPEFGFTLIIEPLLTYDISFLVSAPCVEKFSPCNNSAVSIL